MARHEILLVLKFQLQNNIPIQISFEKTLYKNVPSENNYLVYQREPFPLHDTLQ